MSEAPPALRPVAARTLAFGAAVLAAVLGVVARHWIASIGCAIPDAALQGNAGWGADARLWIWILAWVARTLPSAPAQLFDPPVGYPAPAALTGSEHLLGSQLFFAPVFAASGNPVLAANLATLASYLLGGIAMFALLRAWGIGTPGALAGGLANMFGPLQAPADLHVLQYPAFCLPLVLWAAVAVAERATAARVLLLSGALVLATLASYQTTANVALLLAIVVGGELAARRPRAAAWVVATAVPVGLVLVAVSWPYFGRLGEPRYRAAIDWQLWDGLSRLSRLKSLRELRWSVAVLALVGVAGWRHLGRGPRRGAALGVAAVLAGGVLAAGWSVGVGGASLPLPYALFALSPAGPAVMPWRFMVLAGTGLAVLAGCGIEALTTRVGRGPRTVLAWLLVAAVGIESARAFGPRPLTCLPVGARVPPVYTWLHAHADGPLLELPNPLPDISGRSMLANAEAMYGSLFHGLPVLNLHTNHAPVAWQLVQQTIDRLPEEDALQALVDMTHVRWILVRRDRLPPGAFARWEALELPGLVEAATFPGELLLAVRRAPENDWFAALSRPPRAGATILGTPLRPLGAPAAHVRVAPLDDAVPAGAVARLRVTLRNEGPEAWPVAVPRAAPATFVVALEVRWDGPAPRVERVPLPFDVEPGRQVSFAAPLIAPPEPGLYTLRWTLIQSDGPPFPASAAWSMPVRVDAVRRAE